MFGSYRHLANAVTEMERSEIEVRIAKARIKLRLSEISREAFYYGGIIKKIATIAVATKRKNICYNVTNTSITINKNNITAAFNNSTPK